MRAQQTTQSPQRRSTRRCALSGACPSRCSRFASFAASAFVALDTADAVSCKPLHDPESRAQDSGVPPTGTFSDAQGSQGHHHDARRQLRHVVDHQRDRLTARRSPLHECGSPTSKGQTSIRLRGQFNPTLTSYGSPSTFSASAHDRRSQRRRSDHAADLLLRRAASALRRRRRPLADADADANADAHSDQDPDAHPDADKDSDTNTQWRRSTPRPRLPRRHRLRLQPSADAERLRHPRCRRPSPTALSASTRSHCATGQPPQPTSTPTPSRRRHRPTLPPPRPAPARRRSSLP